MTAALPLPPLSVLDLSPIVEGGNAATALAHSLDLAQHAEAWGYQRYWVAEHHNMDGVACSATAVLIAHLAAGTRTIRLGAGGVMLPNHAPLVIAEQFGTLATLHPGRIDLGLGRAPGTNRPTMHALRRHLGRGAEDDFPAEVMELMAYLAPARAGQAVRAIPGEGTEVPVWILGSSLYGAQLAAHLGLPYAFASHFAPDLLEQALEVYRATYRPSARWPRPHAMVGVNVIVADDDEAADTAATSLKLRFLGMQRGQRGLLPRPITPQQWQAMCTPAEHAGVERMLACSAVGRPQRVHEQLGAILARTGADEFIVACAVHDHATRLRSYELLAGLPRAASAKAAAPA